MPGHVADLVAEFASPSNGSRVAILGYAYLQDTDDTRNSPSQSLLKILTDSGYDVAVHDPFVADYRGDVLDALRDADCVVLMVAHRAYRELDLNAAARHMRHARLVDARGFFTAEQLEKAGFEFRTIGIGSRSGRPA
jgi:UDP-N-acetyl-D-mannosaminuronic acid dehydrogenase